MEWDRRTAPKNLVEQIADQMEIGAEFSDAFLLEKTGDLYRIHEFNLEPTVQNQIDQGILRFVPPICSQDLYLWMLEFTTTVADAKTRAQLTQVLNEVSAVWKFRNILYHRNDVARQWSDFKRQKLLAVAQDWLDSTRNRIQ